MKWSVCEIATWMSLVERLADQSETEFDLVMSRVLHLKTSSLGRHRLDIKGLHSDLRLVLITQGVGGYPEIALLVTDLHNLGISAAVNRLYSSLLASWMNRKQRRVQGGSSTKVENADDIPHVHPDRDGTTRKAKTLYEIAAERQAALMPDAAKFDARPHAGNVVNVKIGPGGEVIPLDENDPGFTKDLGSDVESEAVSPILDTLFLATSLSALHFTLEVLTVHQYAEKLEWRPIAMHAILQAFPTLVMLIHLLRGHLLNIPVRLSERSRYALHVAQQGLLLFMANVAGCYLIYLTNDKGYMAVMKNAPSIGTLWVLAVLELGPLGALAGVVGPGSYAWYHGYRIL